MSCSQYYPDNYVMDMGALFGSILGTMLNYGRDPCVHFKGPLTSLMLTVAHMGSFVECERILLLPRMKRR